MEIIIFALLLAGYLSAGAYWKSQRPMPEPHIFYMLGRRPSYMRKLAVIHPADVAAWRAKIEEINDMGIQVQVDSMAGVQGKALVVDPAAAGIMSMRPVFAAQPIFKNSPYRIDPGMA